MVIVRDNRVDYLRRVVSADGVRGLVKVSVSSEIADTPGTSTFIDELLSEEASKYRRTVVNKCHSSVKV